MIEASPNSPDQNQPRIIYVKNELFSEIESGRKTLELRVAFGSFSNIKTGSTLEFRKGNGQSIKVNVRDVRFYSNLSDILEKEEVSKIAPGLLREEAIAESEKFFKKSDVERYGLVVIDFEKSPT